jgi:uncharacterized protein
MFDKKSRLNRRLLRAVKHGDEQKAILALEQGAEIDVGRASGKTPLIKAIIAGKWSMACLLVEKGADVQGNAPACKTPLIHAVERGDAAIVRRLLESGAAPDAIHTYHRTESYQRERGKGIFKETEYYTETTTHHLTALTAAAYAGNSEIVRLLLDAGASRDLCGKDGMNAISCAEAGGHIRIAALLRAVPAPAPAPQNAEPRPGDIVFQRPLGDSFLEEIFDFTARERISLIRKGEGGPIETETRESFETLVDTPSLRAAFNEHLRRGGTVSEEEIFSRSLDKPRLKAPRN